MQRRGRRIQTASNPVARSHLDPDKTYAKRGAFLRDVPFDPLEWGVPPSIVPATDTTQLLALIVAKRVLEDAAQGQFESRNRERMSVIVGQSRPLSST